MYVPGLACLCLWNPWVCRCAPDTRSTSALQPPMILAPTGLGHTQLQALRKTRPHNRGYPWDTWVMHTHTQSCTHVQKKTGCTLQQLRRRGEWCDWRHSCRQWTPWRAGDAPHNAYVEGCCGRGAAHTRKADMQPTLHCAGTIYKESLTWTLHTAEQSRILEANQQTGTTTRSRPYQGSLLRQTSQA